MRDPRTTVDARPAPAPARALAAVSIAAAALAAASTSAQIADSSFEVSGPAGPSGGPWQQASNLAGSPLCDASCLRPGQRTRARSGQWWAWFGGIGDATESASLAQTINVPPGVQRLRFQFLGATQRTDAADRLEVRIDNQLLLTITSQDVRPGGQYASTDYIPVDVPIPGQAGGPRQLRFDAVTGGTPPQNLITNFFVDDVAIDATGGCYPNCDGSTGTPILSPADFVCFLTRYRAGDAYANCDGSTNVPTLTPADFVCFLQRFRAGC